MYLATTSASPLDNGYTRIVIGPFQSKQQLDAFLDIHGRVFNCIDVPSVMSPDEYTKAAQEHLAEMENA